MAFLPHTSAHCQPDQSNRDPNEHRLCRIVLGGFLLSSNNRSQIGAQSEIYGNLLSGEIVSILLTMETIQYLVSNIKLWSGQLSRSMAAITISNIFGIVFVIVIVFVMVFFSVFVFSTCKLAAGSTAALSPFSADVSAQLHR